MTNEAQRMVLRILGFAGAGVSANEACCPGAPFSSFYLNRDQRPIGMISVNSNGTYVANRLDVDLVTSGQRASGALKVAVDYIVRR